MGSSKQLLKVGGISLVVRAADAALESGAALVAVVVGAAAEKVLAELAGRPILAAHNPQWATGLASSIRVGMAALLGADPALDAVVVAPCDQPALSAAVIAQLSDLQQATGRIAAACYGGRNGAPAVFGREHFTALSELSGDEGARRLLNSGLGNVAALELPALAADLDTPADYAAWIGSGS
jgi:molybdenum cofactor cytidylyltransferase